MLTSHAWVVYCAAALGLALTPGPNSLLVLSHGALHGHRKTLFTVFGGALGFLALITLSMLGIGALLRASAGALTILKLAGGAYLIWLGVQLWRARPMRLTVDADSSGARGWILFRQGLLTAVSNPKALLFHGAFLPQLLDPRLDIGVQFMAMGFVFVTVEILVEYALALLAHRIRPVLERFGKGFNRVCGGLFITMGVALPAN